MKTWLICSLLIMSLHCRGVQNDVTSKSTQDKLVAYIKAKWVAKKVKGFFVLKPFSGCEHFAFGSTEHRMPDHLVPYVRAVSYANSNINWIADPAKLARIVATRSTRGRILLIHGSTKLWDQSDIFSWEELVNDEDFRASMIKSFTADPKKVASLPEAGATVAVCVRYGKGNKTSRLSPQFFDGNRMAEDPFKGKRVHHDLMNPEEYPPLQFYLDQIQKIASETEGHLYAKIFTDASNPNDLLEAFKERIENKDITLECYPRTAFTDKYLIEEMVDISRFKYLVHSQFSFPKLLTFLGSYTKTLYPKDVTWENGFLKVTAASE